MPLNKVLKAYIKLSNAHSENPAVDKSLVWIGSEEFHVQSKLITTLP